jgi:phage terminase large subunit
MSAHLDLSTYPLIPNMCQWTCSHCKHVAPLEDRKNRTLGFWRDDSRTYACPSCKREPADIPQILIPMRDGTVNRFYVPTPKQVLALLCPAKNLLWGGRAGTGKSHWLRCEAYMRCLTVPGYRALLLRRQFTELRDTHLDKAAIEAEQLGAVYRATEYTVVFSNGSRLRFGHCEDDNAVRQYLSSEFDWIGYDEGTTFTEYAFRFINSRLRTTKPGVIPLCRMGSNPGAQWVARLFIRKDVDPEEDPSYDPDDYFFIPAAVEDNPHVNLAEQQARLNALPSAALRRMYSEGDWDAIDGQMFEEWTPTMTDPETHARRPWHVIHELPRVHNPRTGGYDPIDCAPSIPVTVVMDWGYDPDPGVVVWYAHMPSGRFIAIQEWVFRKTLPSEVAKEIVARSKGMTIRQRIAGHDIWIKERETGKPMAETFAQHGVSFSQATFDRENGWIALHALLRGTVDDGQGAVPMLQVYIGECGDGCPTLARTLPMLQNDPKHPGDCLQRDDHAPDTARWFAIGRPTAPRERKRTAWDRLSPEAKRRIRQQGRTYLGTESVRRH